MRHEGMKRALFCVLVMVAMTAITASSALAVNNAPVTEDAPHKWTIAMYWCSDNNLDEYTDYFVNLWGDALTNRDDIALCIFLDRAVLPTNISTLTEDGWVEEADLGEVNSSSPDTLASFITYSLTEPKLASENFMLMIQDHGNGYLGLCSDEGLPDSDLAGTWMSIDDLGRGVNDALAAAGKPIDIIAIDACTLASIEVAYELEGTASYLVASQLGVPFDGMNYDALLSGLSENPSIQPLDLACKLVDDYEAWYSAPLGTYPTLYPYMQDYASLSVIDLNALDGLVGAFASFADAVTPKITSIGSYIRTAAVQADVSLWMNNMGTWFYPDIRIMFTDLAARTDGVYPEVHAACDAIVQAANAAVLYDWASWRMRGLVTGLSVFGPPSIGIFEQYWDSFERAYDSVGLDFVDDSGWDTVLLEYFYTVKQYTSAS